MKVYSIFEMLYNVVWFCALKVYSQEGVGSREISSPISNSACVRVCVCTYVYECIYISMIIMCAGEFYIPVPSQKVLCLLSVHV